MDILKLNCPNINQFSAIKIEIYWLRGTELSQTARRLSPLVINFNRINNSKFIFIEKPVCLAKRKSQ